MPAFYAELLDEPTPWVAWLACLLAALVTAAIAAPWVQTEERSIERAILRDLHRQIDTPKDALATLRGELRRPWLSGRPDRPTPPG